MTPDKKMDLDEPVNVDMEPEDALRILLGEERRDSDAEAQADDSDTPGADVDN